MRFVYQKEFVAQRALASGRCGRRPLPIARPQHRYRRRSRLCRLHRSRHRRSRSSPTGASAGCSSSVPGWILRRERGCSKSVRRKATSRGRSWTRSSRTACHAWTTSRWSPPTSTHASWRTSGARTTYHRGSIWSARFGTATPSTLLGRLPRLLRAARPRHRRQAALHRSTQTGERPSAQHRPRRPGRRPDARGRNARHRDRAPRRTSRSISSSRRTSCPTSTMAS